MNRITNAIIDEDMGVSMEYINLIKNTNHRPVWVKYFANDMDLLYQGVGVRVEGTNTMFYLPHNNIPENR